MIKMLFIVPLVLSLIWLAYLKQFGYTLEQGKTGFLYICIFTGAIALFYGSLLWLTHL